MSFFGPSKHSLPMHISKYYTVTDWGYCKQEGNKMSFFGPSKHSLLMRIDALEMHKKQLQTIGDNAKRSYDAAERALEDQIKSHMATERKLELAGERADRAERVLREVQQRHGKERAEFDKGLDNAGTHMAMQSERIANLSETLERAEARARVAEQAMFMQEEKHETLIQSMREAVERPKLPGMICIDAVAGDGQLIPVAFSRHMGVRVIGTSSSGDNSCHLSMADNSLWNIPHDFETVVDMLNNLLQE